MQIYKYFFNWISNTDSTSITSRYRIFLLTNERKHGFCVLPFFCSIANLAFYRRLIYVYKKRMLHYQHPLAERQGFEPWDQASWSTVFETAPIDHSGIFPWAFPFGKSGAKVRTFSDMAKMFFQQTALTAVF